jgi:hypothetical protein
MTVTAAPLTAPRRHRSPLSIGIAVVAFAGVPAIWLEVTVIRHAIALFAVAVLVPAAAGQTGSLGLITPPRADAPLQIVAAMFNDTMLTVLLVNVSGRPVEEAAMGVVLGDRASPAATVTRTGNACRATVPPDGFLVVTEAHVGFDTADSYFREKGVTKRTATIGLTHVRFAGGTEWNYPLEAKGRFEEQLDPALKDRVQALTQKYFPDKDMSWAFPGPGQGGKVNTCRK